MQHELLSIFSFPIFFLLRLRSLYVLSSSDMSHANRLYLVQYGAVQAVLQILVTVVDPVLPGCATAQSALRFL